MAGSSAVPQHSLRFCDRCDKPFVNDSAHKRHLRYCGSRTRTRPRSCRACNAAKVKCSFDLPCSRCTQKSIECFYGDASIPRLPTAALGESSESSRPQHAEHSRTNALTNMDYNFVDALPWDVADGTSWKDVPIFDLGAPSPTFLDYAYTGYASTADLPEYDELDSTQTAPDPPAWCTWSMGDSSLSVLKETSLVYTEGAISSVRNHVPSHSQHVIHLIAQSLRAIPTMILRRQTFPAFIHRRSKHVRGDAKPDLPVAITACMSLAHLFNVNTPETKSFLWPAIRKEYTRFLDQMIHMSPVNLQASIQACMVYLVMSIITNNSESDKIGGEILLAVHQLYIHCKGMMLAGTFSQVETHRYSSSWDAWILEESRRRITVLWFLVGLVVCIKSGRPLDVTQSYRTLLLPCPKVIWDADDELEWQQELLASRQHVAGSKLETLGDLLDAQKDSTSSAATQKLDIWNAGGDSFGNLLNLVSTVL